MPIRPNFSYEVERTYTKDSGENRIVINMIYTEQQEVEGEIVNTEIKFATLDIGILGLDPETVDKEALLKEALPQYFTE
jgi:hypothetical protein